MRRRQILWAILGGIVVGIAIVYGAYALFLYWLVNCSSPNVVC